MTLRDTQLEKSQILLFWGNSRIGLADSILGSCPRLERGVCVGYTQSTVALIA